MTKRRTTHCQLGVERLENRQLMAADFAAVICGGPVAHAEPAEQICIRQIDEASRSETINCSSVFDGPDGDAVLAAVDRAFAANANDVVFGEFLNFSSSPVGRYLHADSGIERLQGVTTSDAALADVFEQAVDAVMDQWLAAGVKAEYLADIDFRVTDLADGALGLSVQDADGTRTIWIDATAQGKGWFIDATPYDNSEFGQLTESNYVAVDGVAVGRFDLVTVLGHEIGHMAGLEHTDWLSVMYPTLELGQRMLPNETLGATAHGRHEAFVDPMLSNLWAQQPPYRQYPTPAELAYGLQNIWQLGPYATPHQVGQAVVNNRANFLNQNGYGFVNNLAPTSQLGHALMFGPNMAYVSPGVSTQNGMIHPLVWGHVQDANQARNMGYGATNFNYSTLGNIGGVNSIVGMLQGVGVGLPTTPVAGTIVAGFGPPIGTLPQDRMHYYGAPYWG